MALDPTSLPRDPDLLIEMLLAKDAELDRLKICLKAVNALVMGARSERSSAALPEQLDLELGDLQT